MKKFLFIFLALAGFCYGQKTFIIDTTSLKVKTIMTSALQYVHFYSSGTQNIVQKNDSTFQNYYTDYTPYIFSVYSTDSDSKQDTIGIYKNGVLISSIGTGYNFSSLINMMLYDSLQFKISNNKGDSDTLKVFKLSILRFP